MRWTMALGAALLGGCEVTTVDVDFGDQGVPTDYVPGEVSSPDALAWRATGTLYSDVNSVVLRPGAHMARAGMYGVITCDVHRDSGEVGADIDFPGDGDEVLDV